MSPGRSGPGDGVTYPPVASCFRPAAARRPGDRRRGGDGGGAAGPASRCASGEGCSGERWAAVGHRGGGRAGAGAPEARWAAAGPPAARMHRDQAPGARSLGAAAESPSPAAAAWRIQVGGVRRSAAEPEPPPLEDVATPRGSGRTVGASSIEPICSGIPELSGAPAPAQPYRADLLRDTGAKRRASAARRRAAHARPPALRRPAAKRPGDASAGYKTSRPVAARRPG